MFELKLGKEKLKVKYGYKPTVKSGIIKKLVELDSENTENSSALNGMDEIMLLLPEMILVGVQKYHRDDYGYDYDTGEGKEEQLEKIYALLDDYFDEEESSFLNLFENLQNELIDNSFLASLFRDEKKKVENPKTTQA